MLLYEPSTGQRAEQPARTATTAGCAPRLASVTVATVTAAAAVKLLLKVTPKRRDMKEAMASY